MGKTRALRLGLYILAPLTQDQYSGALLCRAGMFGGSRGCSGQASEFGTPTLGE